MTATPMKPPTWSPGRRGWATTNQRMEAIAPPPSSAQNPTQLLLGLMVGASFFLPHAVPAKKAAASPTQVAASGKANTNSPDPEAGGLPAQPCAAGSP